MQNNRLPWGKKKKRCSAHWSEEKLLRMVGEFAPDKKNDFKASNDAKFFLQQTLAIIRVRCYGSVEVSTELHRTLSPFPLSLCKCESNNKSCWQLLPRLLAGSQELFEEYCEQYVQRSQHPLTISLVSPVTYRTCYFSPVSNPSKCWISNISTKYH